MQTNLIKNTLLLILFVIALLIFYFIKPIAQPANYHQFADARVYLGIPNFSNVMSNLFFLLIGCLGLTHLNHIPDLFKRMMYLAFFAGVILVTFGSSYYHLSPNNFSLLWDRIPIAIVMMCFVIIIIYERINKPFAKIICLPLIIIGILTTLYWYATANLTPYLFTQIFPAIFIPATLLLYPQKDTYIWWALVMYLLGRITEYFDHGIYQLSFQVISGHTLKHLLMALGLFAIYLYATENHKSNHTS